ncbi:glycosyltransferase [filamentous cyanobacterium LEGE 11480]|uniref:Glycosyltransferase n=1 Tax=Romeriopsis navalis LEGE 11480 TaxID=2777977 RepID=A0A928VMT9_9CYAN|nr:glycosyltransferase [Romeriopsis navalis]MBE9030578.1 glycosyltransferase [Romeriopsis navalis LEGE 11480]
MSVYFYVHYFPAHEPPVQNGVVRAVHGLVSSLAKCGEAITLLSEGPQTEQIQTATGYQHRCFANSRSHPSTHLAPDLIQFVQQRLTPQDLVILNGGFHLNVYALAKLLKQHNIPYVVAPHLTYDRYMFAKSRTRKYPYWYLCEKATLQNASAVQVLDQSQAIWLRRRGITTPIITVQNGFAPTDIPAKSSLSWRTNADQRAQLLFFGRLCRHIKGLDLLLEALAQFNAPNRPHLTLQGPEVGDRQILEAQTQALKIDDRVNFCSPEYASTPAAIMAQYDIVCLPSRSEGFGLTALEAMLAGRVLLVSEHAGIATHIRASGCGIVVKPNAESIHAGLVELLNCRHQWASMGLRGREYAIQHLSWQQIALAARQTYSTFTPIPPERQSASPTSNKAKWSEKALAAQR